MSEIPYSVRGGRSTTSVDGLTDTNITNLQNQQILKYDSASQKWVNAVDGGGDATISSLGDTLISNPQTNQSLVYNATVSPARWENQPTPFTQSDFTNTVSTDAAFIKHKPIITTTSLATMVGISTGINKEGDLTAFGKGAGYAGKNGHICIGELSGNLGSTRAISLGYNTHATHVNSVVIHGGVGLSSSATNAFYIDPLRTLDALTENVGDMKINMYNTSTKEIFLTNNLLVPGNTKLNGTLEVSNGIGAVNQVLTSNNTGALTWTDKSQLSANIYDLGGLTWANISDNELIRRVDATNADGTGMTITDVNNSTDIIKSLSFFNRVSPFNVPLGLIDYSFNISSTVYKTHISPKSSHANTSNGMFLQATSTLNKVKVGINNSSPSQDLQVGTTLYVDDTNRNVGINNSSPSQDFQVGTTIYVDDTNKRVGINQAAPTVDLEVLNTMYVNSNTRRVGIVNATPTTNFQVGTTLNVNLAQGRVGIGIVNPDENLEVDGSIQIDSANQARLKFQQSGPTPHALGEIDGEQDGTTNGGILEFYTKVDNGNVTEKLRINNAGAIGIAGANYGLKGQVLTSNDDGSPPSWTGPISGPAIYFYASKQTTTQQTSNTGPIPITGFHNLNQTSGYNMFDVATGIFTAPITGAYLVNYSANIHDGIAPHLEGVGSILQLDTGSGFVNYKYNYNSVVNNNISNQQPIYINLIINLTAGHRIRHCADVYMVPASNYDVRGDTSLIGFTYQSVNLVTPSTGGNYTAGTNMTLVGTEFNIPQSIATTSSPTFNQVNAATLSSADSNMIVPGSGGINAGIYNYVNWKNVPSSTAYTRYDFFRVPRISSLNTKRLMYLTIQSEFRNDQDAFYQEEIVKWNDRTGEITGLSVTNHLPGATPVATSGVAPVANATNSNKIWVWENNTDVYVSFINLANSAHRMLIQLKLFSVRHADGGIAFVL